MALYPGDEVDGDPSNWVGPNDLALAEMLGRLQFSRVTIFKESRLYRVLRASARRSYRSQQGRIVAHAFR